MWLEESWSQVCLIIDTGTSFKFAFQIISFLSLTKIHIYSGAGDRDRRWAHQLHNQQDWISGWCQPVTRSRWSQMFLLSGSGPQMSGVLTHRTAFQDQAHLIIYHEKKKRMKRWNSNLKSYCMFCDLNLTKITKISQLLLLWF